MEWVVVSENPSNFVEYTQIIINHHGSCLAKLLTSSVRSNSNKPVTTCKLLSFWPDPTSRADEKKPKINALIITIGRIGDVKIQYVNENIYYIEGFAQFGCHMSLQGNHANMDYIDQKYGL